MRYLCCEGHVKVTTDPSLKTACSGYVAGEVYHQMSSHIHTTDQPCDRSKNKQNTALAHRNREEKPLPRSVPLQGPPLPELNIVLIVQEKCLVQSIIIDQVLSKSGAERQKIHNWNRIGLLKP